MSAVLGAVCVMVACGGLWYLDVHTQRKHLRTLSQLSGAMLTISGEIQSHQTPLPRIFEGLSHSLKGEARALFEDVIKRLQEGEGLQESWEQGVESGYFPGDIEDILLQVGRSFMGDEEKICKVLSLAHSCFERVLSAKQGEFPNRRRSYGALCFSGGALLLILLM